MQTKCALYVKCALNIYLISWPNRKQLENNLTALSVESLLNLFHIQTQVKHDNNHALKYYININCPFSLN